MKKNILITWTSKWIWKYLSEKLEKNFNIFWISREKSQNTNINFNLTNFELFDDFCEKLEKENTKFDTIILNAGVWYFWNYEDISPEKYKEIINLNLLSPILFLQKLFPFLEKKAKIIFIWSISGKKFLKSGAVYQASKFGLRWFAWALKNEFKNQIHIINPKLVETDFHKNSFVKIDYKKERITKLEDILKVIEDILDWNETKFEIDL